MTDDKLKVVIPREVYDFLIGIDEDDPIRNNITALIAKARSEKEHDVAKWLKDNPIQYGVGWAGEFITEDEEAPPPPRRKQS